MTCCDADAAPHPLDPLTAGEIARAVAAVRAQGGLDAGAWVETVALDDMAGAARGPFGAAAADAARVAYVCFYEPSSNRTFRGRVDLGSGRLIAWEHVPGAQARITGDEFALGGRIALADPGFRAALTKRGLTEAQIANVLVEPWTPGEFGLPGEEGLRFGYGQVFLRNEAGDNAYARPIANLHPVIDLRERRVIRIDDFGAAPLPPDPGPIAAAPRTDLKPLDIVQPEGPSFTVEGRLVRWLDWELRIGFEPRDGLVLRDIGWRDRGRLRPVMRRASLAEMVVPYGDPRGGAFRRNAFDVGEYGIGQLAESLKLGCDCLGHIRYFDAVAHDWRGEPVLIENAICMHEEDYGLLWKYTEAGRCRFAVRSRRLVVSSISTIGNYVYGLYFYFYQDGGIGAEVKATGIPYPSGIGPDGPSPYGAVVGDGVESHVHQHSFCFRFDMCVDGDLNAVEEVDCEPLPRGPGNPHGNGARVVSRRLRRESEARREIDLGRARFWKVVNPGVLNRFGEPVGYKLTPGPNALPFVAPDSPIGRRAAFMFSHLWVTPFAEDEKYPTGWFPNRHPGGDGLPRWTAADRDIEGRPIVVWHTVNYHHTPRPEDFPVQPVVYAGFHWAPSGFFDANPAMDAPQAGR